MDEIYISANKNEDDNLSGDTKFMNNCVRSLKNNTFIVGIKQKGVNIKAFVTKNTKYYTLGKIAIDTAKLG